ncbi:hypothetical protein AN639_07130 [Candidatus Epulonipiscium fishelsonii]|uniref:Uncharacterized protein n=1 Tax=Candidatus Epulonipiscium fishelsonii TaxID=77094 RepID=A0ACC8XAJ4_9FIRM|nr:hypothetical protein AN639_07130 [Epulopiscium sp. SCG-B05WGA-EpuloA1]ONI39416.1 hypothetical protein AN396_08405 [Epulopiscium sp. SCG-B11WGA-EpuloA1]
MFLDIFKRRKEKKQSIEAQILSEEVSKVQEKLAATLCQFEDTTDHELLDYYTYYYKANEIRHTYLMRKLKEVYYK